MYVKPVILSPYHQNQNSMGTNDIVEVTSLSSSAVCNIREDNDNFDDNDNDDGKNDTTSYSTQTFSILS